MSTSASEMPHFLRVVRALTRATGAVVPVAVVATTTVGLAACHVASGTTYMTGNGGAGGASSSSGHPIGSVTMTGNGGAGGQAVGFFPMTGGGGGAGGHQIGSVVMNDGGTDAAK